MEKDNLELIKELFNIGKLTLNSAIFFETNGYEIICSNGKVEYISLCE